MVGRNQGFAHYFKLVFKRCVFVHCIAHRLILGLSSLKDDDEEIWILSSFNLFPMFHLWPLPRIKFKFLNPYKWVTMREYYKHFRKQFSYYLNTLKILQLPWPKTFNNRIKNYSFVRWVYWCSLYHRWSINKISKKEINCINRNKSFNSIAKKYVYQSGFFWLLDI